MGARMGRGFFEKMFALLACIASLAIAESVTGVRLGLIATQVHAQQRQASGSPGAIISSFRRQNGLQPVRMHPLLQREAQKHSRAMASLQSLTHQIQPGMGVYARLSAAGFNRPVAENVSMGGSSAAAVISRWIKSPGHRQNMLDARYNVFGFAVATDRSGRRWWTLIIGAQ